MTETPYNPLEKANLARSIEADLLARAPTPLSDVDHIVGAGIYAIYYTGPFPAYERTRATYPLNAASRPIYVGKAIPKGGRKGGLTKDSSRGYALADRLRQHAASVDQVGNLGLTDFWVRYLIVEDIWIPLGENILIERFQPVWNRAIDGFGNKDPGRRRATQYRSPWDVLHPGRIFAQKLANSPMTQEFLVERVDDYFSGRPVKSLPKAVERQLAEEQADYEAEGDGV
jgi:hypothetical protein